MDLDRIRRFLTEDIWTIDRTAFGRRKARGVRYLQITILVCHDVGRQKIGLRGVALAFFFISMSFCLLSFDGSVIRIKLTVYCFTAYFLLTFRFSELLYTA